MPVVLSKSRNVLEPLAREPVLHPRGGVVVAARMRDKNACHSAFPVAIRIHVLRLRSSFGPIQGRRFRKIAGGGGLSMPVTPQKQICTLGPSVPSLICGALPLFRKAGSRRPVFPGSVLLTFCCIEPSTKGQILIFLILSMMNGPTFCWRASPDVAIVCGLKPIWHWPLFMVASDEENLKNSTCVRFCEAWTTK